MKSMAANARPPATGSPWPTVQSAPSFTMSSVAGRPWSAARRTHEATAQVIAANVDVICLVTSANRDLNPRRIERYLTAVWESGAEPVVVLNKVDLVADVAPLIDSIAAVALAVPVVQVSALTGAGVDHLPYPCGVWSHRWPRRFVWSRQVVADQPAGGA